MGIFPTINKRTDRFIPQPSKYFALCGHTHKYAFHYYFISGLIACRLGFSEND